MHAEAGHEVNVLSKPHLLQHQLLVVLTPVVSPHIAVFLTTSIVLRVVILCGSLVGATCLLVHVGLLPYRLLVLVGQVCVGEVSWLEFVDQCHVAVLSLPLLELVAINTFLGVLVDEVEEQQHLLVIQ